MIFSSQLKDYYLQAFIAIDGSSHAFVCLGNEVSKKAMHASKRSYMRVICTKERVRRRFMGN